MTIRAVLDTNTVVSALLWKGPPHQLVARAGDLQLVFFTSPVLLAELEEVLGYARLTKPVAASGLTHAQLLQRYQRIVTVVQPDPIEPTILADPDDDHVLACALAAKAGLIVSGDRHLLSLQTHQGVPILAASGAIQHIENSQRPP